MQQILYTMHFTGHATLQDGSPRVLNSTPTAPSCSIATTAGPQGVVAGR